MSWYRTYRPQTIAGLHIEPVRNAFLRILNSGDFSHAYLLSGPKGTGKTSTARIFAKVLNCESNRAVIEARLKGKRGARLVEPCNECPTCKAITAGISLCVMEMDAASNRGIDDIRNLTEHIGLASGDGAIRVVIIDEVHMLTAESFNALLKVLEEPPAHVVFILATTDPQKIPPTVVSRCVTIPYRKATLSELGAAIETVGKMEKLDLDQEAIARLSQMAEGSFRDGVKLLEQVSGWGERKITLPLIERTLGSSNAQVSESLILALSKYDYEGVNKLFAEFEARSLDITSIQKNVIASLHQRLIQAPSGANPHFPTYIALLKALNVSPAPLLPFPTLPFELACLEWCLQKKTVTTPMSLAQKTKEEQKKNSITLDKIVAQWHLILSGVKAQNTSLEALLKTLTPCALEADVLILEAGFKFHQEQVSQERNLVLLESVLYENLRVKIKVQITLREGLADGKVEEDHLVEAAQVAFLT